MIQKIPNLHRLEIDITYRCRMGCVNCNRMTGIAPPRPEHDMTVAQIERLVEESRRLDDPWRKWFILGGEPTEHPDLEPIIDAIMRYRRERWKRRKEGGDLIVTLCTNGNADGMERIAPIRQRWPGLRVSNSAKTGPVQPHFLAFTDAPIDADPAAAASAACKGCKVSWWCGLGMNYAGFYPCAIAGAIDRVFGLGQPITSLADVTLEAMVERFRVFCPFCGRLTQTPGGGQERLSKSWTRALARYAQRQEEKSHA